MPDRRQSERISKRFSPHEIEENKEEHKSIDNQHDISEYVDENFESDETEELWGITKGQCHQM